MYRKSVLLVPRISCSRDENAISKSQVMDGIFLLSTDANLDASAVLRAYKYQPALEKRHALLKSGLQVAPECAASRWSKSRPARNAVLMVRE
jgi:hypothetical protein